MKGDLAKLVSSHFQLEALATYAPYNIRFIENSLDHVDYYELNNIKLMNEYKKLLIETYDYLIDNSNEILEDSDFNILNDFWSGKMIVYRFGLYPCIKISQEYGEKFLIETIKNNSSEFMELTRACSIES